MNDESHSGHTFCRITPPDVLLIEAAWRFRTAIKAQLIEMGFEVVRLATLEAGLQLLSVLDQARPRLIIADTVGQQDAAVFLPRLRAAAEGIPIILCTGLYDRDMLDLDPGDWDAVLVRPFTIGDVADAVVRVVGSRDP
jgi:DNA-binding response OmpR family regulator